jgi:hypothetical protein
MTVVYTGPSQTLSESQENLQVTGSPIVYPFTSLAPAPPWISVGCQFVDRFGVLIRARTGSGTLNILPLWGSFLNPDSQDSWVDYSSTPLVAVPSNLLLTLPTQDSRRVVPLSNPGGRTPLSLQIFRTDGDISFVDITITGVMR